MAREVWITGIGLASSLGEGLDAHWQAMVEAEHPQPVVDRDFVPPFSIHPMVPLDLDKQIPKRADQRQMETWQRLGTYTAGLALEDAGIAGNLEILGHTHAVVAADGGARDEAVDTAILAGLESAADQASYLNEHLSNDLRPTLFLAQLPNLLAGNISIVHKVTGSSRTFMGEEIAGVSAAEVAWRRIRAGQGDIFLVGGASQADRKDTVLNCALGGILWAGDPVSVWARQAKGGGSIFGSAGAFLVLEAREHAEARGRKPYAKLTEHRHRPEPAAARRRDGQGDRPVRRDPAGRQRAGRGAVRRHRGRHADRRGARPAGAIDRRRPGGYRAGDRQPDRQRRRRDVSGRWSASPHSPCRAAAFFPPADESGFETAGQGAARARGGHHDRRLARRRHGPRRGGGLREEQAWARPETISAVRSSPSPATAWSPRSVRASPIIWAGADRRAFRRQAHTRFPTDNMRTIIAGAIDYLWQDGDTAMDITMRAGILAAEEAIADARIGTKGDFPGPLFAAMPPAEMEWPYRKKIYRDAPAKDGDAYDRMIAAARTANDDDGYHHALLGFIAEGIAETIGTKGAPISLTTACASGATAIQLGVEAIRRGDTQAAISLGADCSVNPEMMIRFALLSALSGTNDPPEEVSKPFSKDRDGFVIAEGAAALVLEDYDAARAARRTDPRHYPRHRREGRRFPPHPLAAGRLGDHRRDPHHHRRRRRLAGRDRLHQRPRHLDAGERQDGGDVAGGGVRRAHEAPADLVQQVDDRPYADRRRRDRGDLLDQDHRGGRAAADHQLPRSRPDDRARRRAERGAERAGRHGPVELLRLRRPERLPRHRRRAGVTRSRVA